MGVLNWRASTDDDDVCVGDWWPLALRRQLVLWTVVCAHYCLLGFRLADAADAEEYPLDEGKKFSAFFARIRARVHFRAAFFFLLKHTNR